MSSSSLRLALVAVVVAVAATLVTVFFSSDPGPGSEGGGPEVVDEGGRDPSKPPAAPDPVAGGTRTDAGASRAEAAPVVATPEDVDPDVGRGSFSGFVRTRDGEAVEGARVELLRGSAAVLGFRGAQEQTGLELVTDDDGVYTFEDIPAVGDYVVLASKEGLGRGEVAHAVRKNDINRAPDIVLGAGARIYGTIVGIGDLRVADAEVRLYDVLANVNLADPYGDRESLAVTRSDDQGQYEFTNVTARALEITVDHPDWSFCSKSVNAPFEEMKDTEIHFLLREPTSVTGVVVDVTGAPIAGALIDATEVNPQPDVKGTPPAVTRSRTRSERDGSFALRRLRQRTQYNLSVRADGFRNLLDGPHATTHLDLNDVRLVMEMQGGVSGVVKAPSGGVPTPFSIRVMLSRGANVVPTAQVARFQSTDGSFAIGSLDPGAYVLEAAAKGFAPTRSDPFTVVTGETRSGVEIALIRGATLRGSIVDPDGQPVSGARITLRENGYQGHALGGLLAILGGPQIPSPTATTRGDGEFVMANLPPGIWQVDIEKIGFMHNPVNDVALADDKTTDLRVIPLSRGGTILGQVVDGGGSPFAAGVVTCTNQMGPAFTGVVFNREVRPDANGRFEFANVPPGEFVVQFKPDLDALPSKNVFATIAVAEKTKRTVQVALNGSAQVKLVVTPELLRGG